MGRKGKGTHIGKYKEKEVENVNALERKFKWKQEKNKWN